MYMRNMVEVGVATYLIGIGFFLLWCCCALFVFRKVGVLPSAAWGGSHIPKSREYEEIEVSVANRITRFAIVNRENAKKLEMASFLYDTIQISFFVFSAPSEFWNPRNEWAEFIIYFVRLFCLDLPTGLMLPLFVIYLIFLGMYLFVSTVYTYTKTSQSPFVQQINATLSVIASMDRNAPEIMNFFFSSMFLTFTRFSFKLISCATETPTDTDYFLIDDFYGDFKCWNSTENIPFLLFCLALLIMLLVVSLFWVHVKGIMFAAFPCTERFACFLILVKFFLCGVMAVFVSMPIVPIACTLVAWLVCVCVAFKQLPYLSYGGQSLHYNTYLIGSLLLGVYFSVCSVLLLTFKHSQLGLLYFIGAIFVLVLAILSVTAYLQKRKSEVFALKNKNFARQLLRCIMKRDMLRACTDYLVLNWCNDPDSEKIVLDIIEKEFTEDEREELFLFSPSKVPFLEWWWKWEFNHPKPGTVHRIVLHRIYSKAPIPSLVDLCCYNIVKRFEGGWRESYAISYDMKCYIEELISPVGDFDPSELIKRKRNENTTTTIAIHEDDINI